MTVNENWPVAAGVPLMTPPVDSDSPVGRKLLSSASVHVSSPVPPVAVNPWLYADPTLPNGRVEPVVMLSGVTFSVNCRAAWLAAFAPSSALMRKVYSPDNVGVPVRTPPDVRVTPGGSDPSICDHV